MRRLQSPLLQHTLLTRLPSTTGRQHCSSGADCGSLAIAGCRQCAAICSAARTCLLHATLLLPSDLWEEALLIATGTVGSSTAGIWPTCAAPHFATGWGGRMCAASQAVAADRQLRYSKPAVSSSSDGCVGGNWSSQGSSAAGGSGSRAGSGSWAGLLSSWAGSLRGMLQHLHPGLLLQRFQPANLLQHFCSGPLLRLCQWLESVKARLPHLCRTSHSDEWWSYLDPLPPIESAHEVFEVWTFLTACGLIALLDRLARYAAVAVADWPAASSHCRVLLPSCFCCQLGADLSSLHITCQQSS